MPRSTSRRRPASKPRAGGTRTKKRAPAKPRRRARPRPADEPAPDPVARREPRVAAAVADIPSANLRVSRVLRQVADLVERGGGDRFRVVAWRRAAKTVEDLREDVAQRAARGREALLELPGIGGRMATAIDEIVRTGTLKSLDEMRKSAPPAWTELLRLPGIGRTRARKIAETLRVGSLKELAEAARAGRLRALRGFGARFEEFVLGEVERLGSGPVSVHRALAERDVASLVGALRELPGVERAEVAGELRRCCATVTEIVLVAAAEDPDRVGRQFGELVEVAQVVNASGGRVTARLTSGMQARLVAVPPADFGAARYRESSSDAHLAELRPVLDASDVTLGDAGLRYGGTRLAAPDEEDVAAALDFPLIPPELREGRGEVEAARSGELPDLVRLEDVRGDLQVHSTDSDGREALEVMAEAAFERGLEYVAITDHTQTLRIAGGMDRRGFERQMRRIDALNARLGSLAVLKGAEVDILRDGSLDLDDDVLDRLDIVLVSIHSSFHLPPEEQTERVLCAVSHPSVDVFAHPRGRRLGRRPGATFDLERVARACADHGVLLEVDGTPERQDLDDEGVRVALRAGAKLVVSTDAHAIRELAYLRFGVDQARRGWATADDVANTRPADEFRRFLHGQRHASR